MAIAFLIHHCFLVWSNGMLVGASWGAHCNEQKQVRAGAILSLKQRLALAGFFQLGRSCTRDPNSPKSSVKLGGTSEKTLMWVLIHSGSRSRSKNRGLCIAHVAGCHSANGISHSENQQVYHVPSTESCSENTQELSEPSADGILTLRALFPEIGPAHCDTGFF